jgi:hypothetical protein
MGCIVASSHSQKQPLLISLHQKLSYLLASFPQVGSRLIRLASSDPSSSPVNSPCAAARWSVSHVRPPACELGVVQEVTVWSVHVREARGKRTIKRCRLRRSSSRRGRRVNGGRTSSRCSWKKRLVSD